MISKINFFTFFLLSMFFSSFGQNDRDRFIDDSLNTLNNIEINLFEYQTLKKNIAKLESNYGYEPDFKLSLINQSFKVNDLDFFKNELTILVKDYGFKIDYLNESESYFQSIMDGDLSEWFKDMYLTNHFYWLKNNFKKQIDQRKLNELRLKDQLINSYAAKVSLIKNLSVEQQNENLELLGQYFFKNATDLYTISRKNDGLPTAKSFGLIQNNYGIVEIHNLQSKFNYEKYLILFLDFYKKAYLNNDINYMFFRNYDNCSYLHTGFQKFGLIKINDIPKEFRKNNEEIKVLDFDFSNAIKKELKWN